MAGISIWSLLLIFAIVLLLFGTKKLKNIGSDLGGAIKNFKKSVNDDKSDKD
jgi:sec-independent protein translocase protein TatA|tara:strand:- start:1300 stop:1455 length:156 start_codon:yes stop_codon:yes gene_type:complete